MAPFSTLAYSSQLFFIVMTALHIEACSAVMIYILQQSQT